MERFLEQSIFKYLRAEPEDHFFLLVSSLSFVTYNVGNTVGDSIRNFSFLLGGAIFYDLMG